MILSCVKRMQNKLGYAVGSIMIAKVLQGSKEKKLLALELPTLSTYGLLKDMGRSEIRAMTDHLEMLGYLKLEEPQVLELTPKAGDVLYRGEKVTMMVRKEPEEQKVIVSKLAGTSAELFDVLKELRGELARENNVPAYVIFSNATLSDMAKKAPKNMSEFRKVSGVGEIKAAWYGKKFLERIADFKLEQAQ